MLKANKRTLIVTSIVTILPILVGIILWKQLPDTMATHFGADNNPNGFSSKAFAVFGLPCFLLAVHWVCAVVTARDPRKQNISPKMYSLVLWFIPLISLIMTTVTYFYNLGWPVDIAFVCQLLVSAVLIVAGNYLPKARQNYTIGIKLPWTLANEENWNRTHRLAGFLWVAAGVLLAVLTFCRISHMGWLIAVFVLAVAIPFVYSYWLHARKSL